MNASLKPVRHLALAILLAGAVSSGSAVEPTATIGVKGRANSYASLAASGRFAALVWGARTSDDVTDVFVATSTDGGRAFSAPTRVNAVAGDASLAGEQPPRIALIPREKGSPSIVLVWTSKAPAGTRLLSARSDNAVVRFSDSRSGQRSYWQSRMGIHHDDTGWRCRRALARPSRFGEQSRQERGHESRGASALAQRDANGRRRPGAALAIVLRDAGQA